MNENRYEKDIIIGIVNETCSNICDLTTGKVIPVSQERKEEFVNAIMNLGKQVPIDLIKKKIEDIVRLSQIEPRENQDQAKKGHVEDVLKIISEGMNDNRQITFTTIESPDIKMKGFLKSNLIPCFKDTALAMEKMGEVLGVPMAKTYDTNYEGKRFIISQDVEEEGKRFLTMQQFNKEYGIEWPHTQDLDEKLKNLIQYPIQSVENYSASEEVCKRFKKDYIRMICFDYITNQTDRNDGNYGVLLDENGDISLAPIFDSDYVLQDPSDSKDSFPFSLHKKYNREDGLRILVALYPDEVLEFIEQLNLRESEIMEIAEQYLSEDMLDGRGNYRNILRENIRSFREIVLNRGVKLNVQAENEPHISMKSVISNAITQGVAYEHVVASDRAINMQSQKEEGITKDE